MSDKDQMIATLRMKHTRDTELASTKQRFALFSQPPPLSIGDDSYDFRTIKPRDETGKPETMARNPCSSALRTGKDPSVYFSKVTYTTIGDLYIDPDRKDRIYELQKKALTQNENIFKPASGYKTIVKGTYGHDSDFTKQEKNFRDSDGKVITHPSNPLAGIRGATTNLYKFPVFMQDPYERKRELEIKERMAHHALLGEKAPFKSTEFGNKPFTKDKLAYGCDQLPKETKKMEIKFNIMQHEAPFKPSHPPKKGYNGYLNKFPQYKPDPIKQIQRMDNTGDKDQATFKPNNGGNLSRPTPTITCNPINIRREMASMSHRM